MGLNGGAHEIARPFDLLLIDRMGPSWKDIQRYTRVHPFKDPERFLRSRKRHVRIIVAVAQVHRCSGHVALVC